MAESSFGSVDNTLHKYGRIVVGCSMPFYERSGFVRANPLRAAPVFRLENPPAGRCVNLRRCLKDTAPRRGPRPGKRRLGPQNRYAPTYGLSYTKKGEKKGKRVIFALYIQTYVRILIGFVHVNRRRRDSGHCTRNIFHGSLYIIPGVCTTTSIRRYTCTGDVGFFFFIFDPRGCLPKKGCVRYSVMRRYNRVGICLSEREGRCLSERPPAHARWVFFFFFPPDDDDGVF